MKPPTPTSSNPLKPDDRPSRRAALVPVLVALAGIGAVAGYAWWQQHRPRPSGPLVPDMLALERGSIRNDDGMGHEGMNDPVSNLLSRDSVADLVRVSPMDSPFRGEPADLPPYVPPDGHGQAVRESGLRRGAGALLEEIVQWRITGATQAKVMDHYAGAAATAGFTPVSGSTSAAASAHNRVFVRSGSDERGAWNEILVVRVRPETAPAAATRPADDDALRVTLWLRYPMSRMPRR